VEALYIRFNLRKWNYQKVKPVVVPWEITLSGGYYIACNGKQNLQKTILLQVLGVLEYYPILAN
jgi:hypothetical protein